MGPPHRRHGSAHGETNGLCPGAASRRRDALCPVRGEMSLNSQTASYLASELTGTLTYFLNVK